mgnify:CR=1 FL=1
MVALFYAYFEQVQNELDLFEKNWTVQNCFGPIEGKGLKMLSEGLFWAFYTKPEQMHTGLN